MPLRHFEFCEITEHESESCILLRGLNGIAPYSLFVTSYLIQNGAKNVQKNVIILSSVKRAQKVVIV
jgi:hypothetical protein